MRRHVGKLGAEKSGIRKKKKGRESIGDLMPIEAEVAWVQPAQTCVKKLAELFPSASPVRIPIRVIKLGTSRRRLQEHTIIEFGTAKEVLFSSALPLEFEDHVRLLNSDGSLDTQATVVAVRYHDGRKAVAVRFASDVANWIIKP
jgi:hypothetical protein